jgi:hypothetical protein
MENITNTLLEEVYETVLDRYDVNELIDKSNNNKYVKRYINKRIKRTFNNNLNWTIMEYPDKDTCAEIFKWVK